MVRALAKEVHLDEKFVLERVTARLGVSVLPPWTVEETTHKDGTRNSTGSTSSRNSKCYARCLPACLIM